MSSLRNALYGAIIATGSLAGVPATAGELPMPEGPVVLRISGDIRETNIGSEAHFDRAMLAAIGETSITTTTIWTEGEQTFTGVVLAELLEAVGAEDGTLIATALNDYAIEIPSSDAMEGFALLAFERNGEPMSVRDKGPLWVVYPYDSDPRFQSEVYYSRSIWQLDRLAVTR